MRALIEEEDSVSFGKLQPQGRIDVGLEGCNGGRCVAVGAVAVSINSIVIFRDQLSGGDAGKEVGGIASKSGGATERDSRPLWWVRRGRKADRQGRFDPFGSADSWALKYTCLGRLFEISA